MAAKATHSPRGRGRNPTRRMGSALLDSCSAFISIIGVIAWPLVKGCTVTVLFQDRQEPGFTFS
jgi:hypothetical protein